MILDKIRNLGPGDYSEIYEIALGATLVSVDNVAKYYMEDNDQEIWDLTEDFPNISPPWPSICFEWVPAKFISSVETGFHPNKERAAIKRSCCVIKTIDLTIQDMTKTVTRDFNCFYRFVNMRTLANQPRNTIPPIGAQLETNRIAKNYWAHMTEKEKSEFFDLAEIQEKKILEMQKARGIRWVACGYWVIEAKTGELRVSPLVLTWGIGNMGNFIGIDPEKPNVAMALFTEEISQGEAEIYAEGFASVLHVPFLALSFLHCKNVSIKENLPEPKVQKYRKSKGKEPLVKFYTLQIDPMKEVLRKKGGSEKTGLKRALHICRGHFATYGDDRPLFGKVIGTFFKPMHRRGSIKEGAVIKNYKVG